ncbi:MAG: hypothetical protein IPN73_17795 [Saprospiraceae bacterium]|nr:hypothetical protein [Saprospiraceae bacterium]MBK8851989.1 hypothetical protein [Saprospiraceae bacterium]
MKVNIVLICLGLIFAVASCTPASENQTPKPDIKSNVGLDADTISQAQFNAWTAAWDSLGSNYSDTALVKYYTMPIVDLAAVLGERASGVRFYQGLEEVSPGHWMAHLVAVGLDEKKAIIPKYYDYSNPCPPICE